MSSPFVPLFFLALSQGAAEPRALPSAIAEVTVYAGSASVRRRAELSGGDARYVLAGLPSGLDPDSVRVRLESGEVLSVELRERFQRNVPDERGQELRERLRALADELSALDDENAVLTALLDHIERLLRQEEHAHQDEVRGARVDPAAWEANFRYLAGKLKELKGELRALAPQREELERALADLKLELGRCESAGGVALQDLILDVLDGRGALELDYVVAGAGWEPEYDLRARKDLSAVELAYRARVHQQTGEDWVGAEIVLSTAQPQRGAAGPEPRPVWLSVLDPRARSGRSTAAAPGELKALSELEYLGYGGEQDTPAAAEARKDQVFAAVEDEGLSVRFRLPRRETIESRPEPTRVWIGRTELALTGEHYCVPALDSTVWLRGRARNTSEWVLLPGLATVFFGADFVGQAALEGVQPGQELELALGADPGLTLKRTLLADLREGAGVFGSRATQTVSWRIELENHGALSGAQDGSVSVVVQEVLPRSRDARVEVELDEARPEPSAEPRWAKEREESGVLTWLVRVPAGGKGTIEHTTELTFPEDLRVVKQ